MKNLIVFSLDTPDNISNGFGLGTVIKNVYSRLKLNKQIFTANADSKDLDKYIRNWNDLSTKVNVITDSIIHSHDVPCNIPALSLKKKFINIPWIHSAHIQFGNRFVQMYNLEKEYDIGTYETLNLNNIYSYYHSKQFMNFLYDAEMEAYKNSDFFIVHSKFMKEEYEKEYENIVDIKRREKTTFVIPNGVDINIFKPLSESEKKEIRKKYNITKKFLFYFGRLAPQKQADLVQLLSFDKYISKNYDIILAGYNTDKTQTHIINNTNVHIMPKLNQIQLNEFLNICEYAVLPSYYEPFGQVGLEAMASGAISILSSGTGFEEFAKDRINCYLCKPDLNNVVEGIKWLDSHAIAKENIKDGAIKTAKEFKWDNIVKYYEDIYNEVRPVSVDYHLIKKENDINEGSNKIELNIDSDIIERKNEYIKKNIDSENIIDISKEEFPQYIKCNSKEYDIVIVDEVMEKSYYPYLIFIEAMRIAKKKIIVCISSGINYPALLSPTVTKTEISQLSSKFGFSITDKEDFENEIMKQKYSVYIFERN